MSVKVGDKVRLLQFMGGDRRVMHQTGVVRQVASERLVIDFPAQTWYHAKVCHVVVVRVTTKKKGSLMTNIRQKIAQLTKSKEDRLFEKHGITSDHGNLTDLGRRVVMDKLFEDKALRAAVLADVEAVEAEADKSSKKSK